MPHPRPGFPGAVRLIAALAPLEIIKADPKFFSLDIYLVEICRLWTKDRVKWVEILDTIYFSRYNT